MEGGSHRELKAVDPIHRPQNMKFSEYIDQHIEVNINKEPSEE